MLTKRLTLSVAALLLAIIARPAYADLTSSDSEAQKLRKDTPWRKMSDAEFASAVEEAGGRVIIGLKSPDAAEGVDGKGRVLISAADLAEGKRILVSLGVEILWEFRSVAAIVAKTTPDVAVQLRRHPYVDYIEPDARGEWAANREGFATTAQKK